MLEGDAAKAFAALDARGGAVIEQRDDQTRIAFIARDFASCHARTAQARSCSTDPRRTPNLTDAIRAALSRGGQLGDEAMAGCVLEPHGLTRAEAAQARSYTPGDIVTFRKGTKGKPRPGVGYRVETADPEAGTVRLVPPNPKARTHDWKPAHWGSIHAEAFAEVEQEFRTGDKVQFTRNDYSAGRRNGNTAMVVAIDVAGSSVLIEKDDGARRCSTFAISPTATSAPAGSAPSIPPKSHGHPRHRPSGVVPRQPRGRPRRLCRHLPRPRRGRDLHRQPRQAHRGARVS